MPISYRSLIPGGFYSSNPTDKSVPVSIRTNNPGAVNGAAWEKDMPGYLTSIKFDGKNDTTVFETPEHGVAVWYTLMQKYRDKGVVTVGDIIGRYGGGQNYSPYANFVADRLGVGVTKEIPLVGDDALLLKFARAMFRYEAGREHPMTDAQILYGFGLARKGAVTAPVKPLWAMFLDFLFSLFTIKTATTTGEPPWYVLAKKEIGFQETGVNLGIEEYITKGKTGHLGDPWCAIFVNAMVEDAGYPGSKSAMARSFEKSGNFIQLAGPALGAITTMWRGSPTGGLGHVFFYEGENQLGVRGIAGNSSDGIRRAYHDANRITGYYWPIKYPLPTVGKVLVSHDGNAAVDTRET